MPARDVEKASTTEGLPVAVSLGPTLEAADVPAQPALVDRRVVAISAVSIAIAIAAGFIAQGLMHLIWFVTNISFHGKASFEYSTPLEHHLGLWVIIIPVIGGIIVGFMARYGHKAIRGHGIPEAMEQVLLNQSRIPPRITFLKPLSAAIAIGTGGPFGAEGPIIATGGALGSVVGQLLPTTAAERKTLLAAGAAAGMAATFGSPVSAVLLAIELLLFEFRPRSLIPVALASAAAAGVRIFFDGVHAVFPMPDLQQPAGAALAMYIVIGAIVGFIAVGVTRAVYAIEDGFEHIPLHWMWWPAIGALAVGIVGYFYPRTLGVGYYNISDILSVGTASAPATFTIQFVAILCLMKFISWAIALGSGTSGGTLAPLFTIGGAVGAVLGYTVNHFIPAAHVDLRVAALVGMAAIFAGASRALLASAVFAFETTLQPLGLLPLLGGCTAAFLVSCLLMRNTIMTEKIARRGVRVPAEYHPDFLDQVLVRDVMTKILVTLGASQTLGEVRRWIESRAEGSRHQGFPIMDGDRLVGVLTRRDLLNDEHPADTKLSELMKRFPSIVYDDLTLRDAADHMVNHNIGRLPVLDRETRRLVGIVTRSDLLGAHRSRITANREARAHITLGLPRRNGSHIETPAA